MKVILTGIHLVIVVIVALHNADRAQSIKPISDDFNDGDHFGTKFTRPEAPSNFKMFDDHEESSAGGESDNVPKTSTQEGRAFKVGNKKRPQSPGSDVGPQDGDSSGIKRSERPNFSVPKPADFHSTKDAMRKNNPKTAFQRPANKQKATRGEEEDSQNGPVRSEKGKGSGAREHGHQSRRGGKNNMEPRGDGPLTSRVGAIQRRGGNSKNKTPVAKKDSPKPDVDTPAPAAEDGAAGPAGPDATSPSNPSHKEDAHPPTNDAAAKEGGQPEPEHTESPPPKKTADADHGDNTNSGDGHSTGGKDAGASETGPHSATKDAKQEETQDGHAAGHEQPNDPASEDKPHSK